MIIPFVRRRVLPSCWQIDTRLRTGGTNYSQFSRLSAINACGIVCPSSPFCHGQMPELSYHSHESRLSILVTDVSNEQIMHIRNIPEVLTDLCCPWTTLGSYRMSKQGACLEDSEDGTGAVLRSLRRFEAPEGWQGTNQIA